MAGDSVEVMPDEIARVGGPPRWVRAVVEDVGETSFLADVEGTPFVRGFEEEGTAWRWPAAGAVRAECEVCHGNNGLGCMVCAPPGHVAVVGVQELGVAPAPVGEGLSKGECRKCGKSFQWGAGHRPVSPGCDPSLCLGCCEEGAVATPAGEVPPELKFCGPLMWKTQRKCCPDCDHGSGESGHRCVGCGTEGSGAAGEVQGSRLVSMGGAGRFSWRLKYEGGTREYVGLLVNDQTRDIVHTERGRDSEAVMNALLARLDSMLDPHDTRAYEPPTVTRVEGSEVPALLRLNAARMGADRRIGDIVHTMQRLRRSLVDVALAWYERQREEWRVSPALRDMNAADREACRQLHERQICSLFEKIAGSL